MALDQSTLFWSLASNFLAFASSSFGLLDLAGERCRNFSDQGLFRPNARVVTPRIGLDNQNLLLVWHLATIKVSFDRVALIFLPRRGTAATANHVGRTDRRAYLRVALGCIPDAHAARQPEEAS
jgi:hypothetical protein